MVHPILAALTLTILNAVKPLHVDDTAFFHVARQIALDPLHPYGFSAFWGDVPVAGNAVLAPPGLPLWWAIGIRAFGNDPVLWKLWLFPVAALLAVALHDLLRRFARGLETPLLWGTLLSPVILPGFNLMLDVPALAFALAAFALVLRACDTGSTATSIAAGVLLAWAAQTKYSAAVMAPTIAVSAFVHRAPGRGLLTLATAGLLFVAWEAFVTVQHGTSHFLLHAHQLHGPQTSGAQASLLIPLVTLLGAVGSAATMVGMAGLGWLPLAVLGVGLAWVGAFASFALVPPDFMLFESRSPFLHRPFAPGHAIFAVLGGIAWIVWFRGAATLFGWRCADRSATFDARSQGDDRVVVAWLALEAIGAVLLSPYAAVRRLVGTVIAGTVLSGRVASSTAGRPGRRRQVVAACVVSVALGVGVYWTDLLEARAVERAVALAAVRVRELQPSPDARVWYAGHWGLQFYAERAGMLAVVPGLSELEPGDWLVVPDAHIHRQAFAIDPSWARLVDDVVVDDGWPWTTLSTFYSGIAPVEGRHAARLRVAIYRITREVVPSLP